MHYTLQAGDAAIMRQALDTHDAALVSAAKQLDRLALPTLTVGIEQANIKSMRALLGANTTALDLSDAATPTTYSYGVTLRTSLWLLLDKLGKLMDTESALGAPTDGTLAHIGAVQALHHRVSGQENMFAAAAPAPEPMTSEPVVDAPGSALVVVEDAEWEPVIEAAPLAIPATTKPKKRKAKGKGKPKAKGKGASRG